MRVIYHLILTFAAVVNRRNPLPSLAFPEIRGRGKSSSWLPLVKSGNFRYIFRAVRLAGGAFILSAVLVGCGGGGGGGGSGSVSPSPIQDQIIPAPPPLDGVNYASTEYRGNYGLQNIQAASAYQRGYQGQDVTVGVIDTGLRTTHTEFSGKVVGGYDFVFPGTPVTDPHGHGTGVAAVIAARRDGRGMHGVAPLAKIMPLKVADSNGNLITGNTRDAMRYALARNVSIINNSWALQNRLVGIYSGRSGNYAVDVPFFSGQQSSSFQSIANAYAGIFSGRDVAMVWGAGNDGWQSTTGRLGLIQITCSGGLLDLSNCSESATTRITPAQLRANFTSQNYQDELGNFNAGLGALGDSSDGTHVRSANSFNSTAPYWTVGNAHSIIDGWRRSGNATYAELDRQFSQYSSYVALRNNWLVVVAVDNRNTIADYSNSCALAAMWCLAAPGSRIYTANATGDVTYESQNGTSFAAPHVSGALAVLKSRLPSMPMYILKRVILTTATDLGTRGLDTVYGHGLLNLGAAIQFQGQVRFSSSSASTQSASNVQPQLNVGHVSPEYARVVLPAAMRGLKTQLAAASVAVELPSNIRYNMPLSEIVEVDSQVVPLGRAAADMLDNNAINGRAGALFAAVDVQAGRFHYVGADLDGGDFGAWQFRHDFCDDCGFSAWQGMGEFVDDGAEAVPTAPFFVRGGDSFMLQMQGDGLRPFVAISQNSFSQTAAIAGDDKVKYRQAGMRWRQTNDDFSILAEASWVGEQGSFAGANFGALGVADADSGQGVIEMRGAPMENWRGFARVETAYTKVKVKGGGFLSSVDSLRATGWRAGLERDFSNGNRARFAVSQEAAIRGQARFDYLQVQDGVLHARQKTADLSGGGGLVYALGYAAHLSDRAQAAVAAEWRNATKKSGAVSAQLRIDF